MATFNRGKLRKLAAAGRLVMVDAYHFDDMYGASRGVPKELPVVYVPPGEPSEFKEGVAHLSDFELTGHGRAYVAGPDKVTLVVHSNLNYTFRILPEAA